MAGVQLTAAAVRADDVTDAITEGQAAYQAGRLGAAQTALQRALERLAEQAAVIHARALPDPLPGWQVEEERTSGTAGTGGLQVRTRVGRRYVDGQGRYVTVAIVTGASMLNELDRMLGGLATGNAAADQRIRWIPVRRELASQSLDGALRMFVGGHAIAVVQGFAPADVILAFAEGIDFARLTVP